LAGAEILTGDFLADDAPQRLIWERWRGADVVLSDNGGRSDRHAQTDHLRIVRAGRGRA